MRKRILLLLFFRFFLLPLIFPPQPKVESLTSEYGFTFTPRYAVSLGLDVEEAYLFLLENLKPASVRIPIYWDEAQPEEETLDLEQIEWMLKESEKRKVPVVLALGYTLFRAPECYAPAWTYSLDKETFKKVFLSFLEKTVGELADFAAVEAWQVENEHQLALLHPWCRNLGDKFLKEEISLVRKTDPGKRPVVITFGGPSRIGNFWKRPISFGDIFAVSFFNKSWNQYVHLYLDPFITRNFQAERVTAERLGKRFWISEFQAEPWPPGPMRETSVEEANLTMSPTELKSKLFLLKKLGGAERVYFWGVEWWYKELLSGRPEMFELGKAIMSPE